jgi:hypothetical protein
LKQDKFTIDDVSGGMNRFDPMAKMPVNESPRLHNQFPGIRTGVGSIYGSEGGITPFPGCKHVPIDTPARNICFTPTSLCAVRLGTRDYEDYSGTLDYLVYLVSDQDGVTYFLLKTLFRSDIRQEPQPYPAGWGGQGQGEPILPDYPNLMFLGKSKSRARVGIWGGSVVNADSLGSMVVFAKDGLYVWPGAIQGMEEKFFSADMSPGEITGGSLRNPNSEKGEGFPQGSTVKWVITASKSTGWEFGTKVSESWSHTFAKEGYGMNLGINPNDELGQHGFDRLQIWGTEPDGNVFYYVGQKKTDFAGPHVTYEDYGRRYLDKPLNRPLLTIPEGNIIKFYNRLLFMSGVKDHPNITYYSTIGQDGVPQPFTFHGVGDVSDYESELLYNFLDWQDDGDAVTAHAVGKPYFYTFKNNVIGWTRGGGPRELALAQDIFLTGKGTPSQQAVASDNQNIFFYCATDRKIYWLRERNVMDISWIVDQDWNHLAYHPKGIYQIDVFVSLYGSLLFVQFPAFKGTDKVDYPAACYVCDIRTVLMGKRPWWTRLDRNHQMFPMINHSLMAPTADVPSFYFVGEKNGYKWPFYTHPAIGSWDEIDEDDVQVLRRFPYSDFGRSGLHKRVNNLKFRAVLDKV